jgi:hypothetical protein
MSTIDKKTKTDCDEEYCHLHTMCLPFSFRHREDINGSYLKIKDWLSSF